MCSGPISVVPVESVCLGYIVWPSVHMVNLPPHILLVWAEPLPCDKVVWSVFTTVAKVFSCHIPGVTISACSLSFAEKNILPATK